MVQQQRFPTPSRVFLDGDQAESMGCIKLPGDDAPERVVFEQLKKKNWLNVASRTGRDHASIADACSRAMLLQNHHDWINNAATVLVLGGDTLWQALCAEWAANCLPQTDSKRIVQSIEDALIGVTLTVTPKNPIAMPAPLIIDSSGNALLFEK